MYQTWVARSRVRIIHLLQISWVGRLRVYFILFVELCAFTQNYAAAWYRQVHLVC